MLILFWLQSGSTIFWKWKKTISKTISASATANVYLKRVYVSQNLKLKFLGGKIKTLPGTCTTSIYYHKVNFKAKGLFSKIVAAIANFASKLAIAATILEKSPFALK